MSRVSENSISASLKHSINRTKTKLEDLQLKGSSLRNITRPSDDPINNVEALSISSQKSDNKQYLRNADYALLHLNVTEKAVEQLTEILNKAKDIAIAQSSDFYGEDIRKNISQEIRQLRNQALALGNKRIGQKYIFSGYQTLTPPFGADGSYKGDKGAINLEISKDFFVPINLNGHEVFYSADNASKSNFNPMETFPNIQEEFDPNYVPKDQAPEEITIKTNYRELASVDETQFEQRDNVFAHLETLTTALENNDTKLIQSLLEKIDNSISRLITLRTKIGSITHSIDSTKNQIEGENVDASTRRSQLVDADVAELFADLQKQQSILQTTYKASQGMMNQKLIDFLR
jgi:flagellar hook-associated protein 3 FlgL